MSQQQSAKPVLVQAFMPPPFPPSETIYFYDGSAKVENGRITKYKDNWLFELYKRGYRPEEPLVEGEPEVAPSSTDTGQATPKPKTRRKES